VNRERRDEAEECEEVAHAVTSSPDIHGLDPFYRGVVPPM
jgi:hypothetical protein